MRGYRLLLFLLLGLFATTGISAQQTQVYTSPDAQFRHALDLFEKEKYVQAQEEFNKIVFTATDKKNLYAVDAQYYSALCAFELFHKDAEIQLKQFLQDHPESPKCARVRFYLGKYNYRKKKYEEAIVWFRQVELSDLQEEELSEYYFKRGYARYETGHLDSARTDFYEIKDLDSKYAPPATYYYSHISYIQGNYETALLGFTKLSSDETFGPVVPYYIAQIYYLQGRYSEVISYAPPLLDSAKRAPEIAHLIGASYYRLSRYRESIPFLLKYQAKTNHFSRHDAYELGFAYYKADSANQAVSYFQQAIADSSDLLAQNAWYHLADCYLKAGDKNSARNAFGKASETKFDPVIREDALFSFARLCYELSQNPFNEAINALNQYLYEYPNTPRRDEAYTLLANAYMSSKNYKDALTSIEKIKLLSPQMQPAYQQVAYNRAVQLFDAKDYTGAITHFDKSLTYPLNRELNANAHYWKAEAWYAKANAAQDTALFTKAANEYNQYLFTPGASILPDYNKANYNIAYCYFQKGLIANRRNNETQADKEYAKSVIWFRKYIANKTVADPENLVFDAYLRMGDGYFRMKDFINSAEFYGKAVETPKSDNTDKDYATFQQAMAYGYLGKSQEKAQLMTKLRQDYPNSGILTYSRFQEARTWHDLRDYDKALEAYQACFNANPIGENAVPSLANMGLIYKAKNDPDKAMEKFKQGVELCKDKKTSDFPQLMREIKSIYIGKGQLDQWETYSASVNFSESENVADSTTFVVARKFYTDGNCSEVSKQCAKYLQKFPAGNYLTDIHYMRAECAYKNNETVTAIESYNAILGRGTSKYTERCLTQLSLLYYKQKDYTNAAVMYGRLERESSSSDIKNNARVNLMHCWVNLGNTDSAAVYAGKVVNMKNLPNDITGEANYILGKSALAKLDRVAAEKYFKNTEQLLPQTEHAAEARYHICWLKYYNKEYKSAEKAILKQINDYAGYSYWSGKGWLLLADNYLALKDTFQAKFVLNNYIENGDVPELQQQAREKLAVIEAARHPANMRKDDDLIIPPPGNGTQPGEQEPEGGGQ
jgi:tetratricopeptide (TPR) repeat protein